MEILVSVVIPVYGVSAEYLKRCIDSVLAQQMNDIEIIVVLDGEQKLYDQLWKQYQDKRIKVIVKKHEGVSAARNAGIKAARGKWILFIDADDWLSQNCFVTFEHILRTEESSMIMLDYAMEYGGRSTISHCYRKIVGLVQEVEKESFIEAALSPQAGAGFSWGKFLASSVLNKYQLGFNVNLVMAEDADFMVRSIRYFDHIYYSSRNDYHYWFNPQSAVRRFRPDYAQHYIDSMNCIKKFVQGHMLEHKKVCDNFILYHLLLIAVNYSFHPDNPESFCKRMKQFKAMVKMPLFQDALNHANLKYYSMTRKITILCVKAHFYLGVALIAQVRHMQFEVTKRTISKKG